MGFHSITFAKLMSSAKNVPDHMYVTILANACPALQMASWHL
jgi:hypothetical protein